MALSRRPVIWAGIAALIGCAACCALPILLLVGAGSGASAFVARFLFPGSELVIAAVVFAGVLGVFALRARGRRKACSTSCSTDGACSPRAQSD